MGKVQLTIFFLLAGIALILFATSARGWAVWQVLKGQPATNHNGEPAYKSGADPKEGKPTVSGGFTPGGINPSTNQGVG